ncbi:MAG: hypothetical protein LBH43_09330 [Treponema sp.]|jgi:hypothetical protein|nr:hypothetical protein [Treponema sp.]
MFSPELKKLLIEVLSSWQVIGVTLALIFYFFILNKVITYRRKDKPLSKTEKKKKAAAAPVPEPSDDDDLGLEVKEE